MLTLQKPSETSCLKLRSMGACRSIRIYTWILEALGCKGIPHQLNIKLYGIHDFVHLFYSLQNVD